MNRVGCDKHTRDVWIGKVGDDGLPDDGNVLSRLDGTEYDQDGDEPGESSLATIYIAKVEVVGNLGGHDAYIRD